MSDRDDLALPPEDETAALLVGFEPVDADDVAVAPPTVEALAPDDGPDRPPDATLTPNRDVVADRGWGYLGVLLAVFLGLLLFAYGCDGDDPPLSDPGVATSSPGTASGTLSASELVFVVDGDTVTLTGTVPDEETRDQLVELAEARYGAGNVVDELIVDDAFTLDGATVSVQGSTTVGDELPEGLVADVVAAMNVEAAGFDVVFNEAETTAMDLEAVVSASGVVLSGSVPDQATLDAVVAAATTVWGTGGVDAAGLAVDELVVLPNGTVRLTGAVDAGDSRPAAFASTVGGALGIDVENTAGIDVGAAALGRLEERLRQTLALTPIVFVAGGATIDPQSDAVLGQVAATLNAAPGVAVQVVGHTDDQGEAAANQVLSESRANAVMQRLVELGVDPTRLSARGAGQSEPVADNATVEGRAANQRIAFEFEGAVEG